MVQTGRGDKPTRRAGRGAQGALQAGVPRHGLALSWRSVMFGSIRVFLGKLDWLHPNEMQILLVGSGSNWDIPTELTVTGGFQKPCQNIQVFLFLALQE